MTTYLLAVCTIDGSWITSVKAKGIKEAEDKFVKQFANKYDFIDYGSDFDELAIVLLDHQIRISDIYDIDEF